MTALISALGPELEEALPSLLGGALQGGGGSKGPAPPKLIDKSLSGHLADADRHSTSSPDYTQLWEDAF
ncbi:MAG: hypothetical protein ACYCW6_21050 [Candidatus Xenobia bacterium]